MQPQLYTGARLTVSINGEVVAAGFVADYNIITGATEIDTVDIVAPVELAPSRIRVSMGMRVYREPFNDPVATRIAPGGPGFSTPPQSTSGLFGDSAGKQGPSLPLTSYTAGEQKAFTEHPYITIEIKDDLDRTVFRVPRAKLVGRSASVSVGDFLQETWQIQGIGYSGPL